MSTPRWLPVVVVMVLACGSERAAVAPGAPAGDVRELSGEVSAIRDGQRRALTLGGVVSGDDVIHTAPDASVVIELRHNGVRWALGPGREKKVADSAAWTAARGTEAVAVTGERSGAAGRHAEREAAGTAATGAVEERAAPTAAAPAAAAPAAAAPAAAAVEPAADLQRARVADPAPTEGETRAAAIAPIADGAQAKGAAVAEPIYIEGSPADQRVLGKRGGALIRACQKKAKGVTGRIDVTITVDRRGRASDVALRADAGLEPVAECARPALQKRLRFAKRAEPSTVRGPIELD
jgi:hypothetical protein